MDEREHENGGKRADGCMDSGSHGHAGASASVGNALEPEDMSSLERLEHLEEITAQLEEQVAIAHTPKIIDGQFRHACLELPEAVDLAPGIKIFGRMVRSLVFSTDIAIIRNCNADAVLAVYPFTCQPAISQALVESTERPVFAGVAGTVTAGPRAVILAVESELQGVSAVVVNAATTDTTIKAISQATDIPVVLTITCLDEYVPRQIEAGARIVNVTAGRDTPELVAELRALYPDLPIIGTGGKTNESMLATIGAGADAVSWTPPSMQELEREAMAHNREMDRTLDIDFESYPILQHVAEMLSRGRRDWGGPASGL